MPRSFGRMVRIGEPNEKPEHKPCFFDTEFAITNLIGGIYAKQGKREGEPFRSDELCRAAKGAHLSFVGAFRRQRAHGARAVHLRVAHRAGSHPGGRFCRGARDPFRVRMVGGRQRAYFHARLLRGAHVLARRGVPRGGQYAEKGDAPYRDAPRRIYEQPRQRQGAPYRQRIERSNGNLSCAPAPRHGGRVRNARRDDRALIRIRLAVGSFESYPDRPRLSHHVQNDGQGYASCPK